MELDQKLRTYLYNAFDPFKPLDAGDPKYVDCREARGDEDILDDLGKRIILSNRNTCYLYSGHRGSGKSTELLRLKQELEKNLFYVVYFDVDAKDLQSSDVQYTDILLACTRHLLQSLKESADVNPIVEWVKSRLQELGELLQTELTFESVSVEGQISELVKITTTMKANPNLRQKVREKLDPHTPRLVDILNEFLRHAKKNLPQNRSKLALIVDSLDRIVPVIQEDGSTNHEHIFLHHASQLSALDCHLIYTVPISLLYSKNATRILQEYDDDPQILPMVMVRDKDDEQKICQPGIAKLKDIIRERIQPFIPNVSLETDIFESEEVLNKLCLISGGYVRNLLQLMQDVLTYTKQLPISAREVRKVISSNRNTFERAVDHNQWSLLAEVSQTKQLKNNDEYRDLLFNNCLLEYRYWDDNEELQTWWDVHPLIRGISEFKQALKEDVSA